VVATDDDVEFLLERRKDLIHFRDEMVSQQRAAVEGGKPTELQLRYARFFRDQASWAMKEYRAICYVISRLVANPPGDCRDIFLSRELSPQADQHLGFVEADLKGMSS
jgi:hypothetical protein